MSGLFPPHVWKSVGTSATMENISGWNYSSASGRVGPAPPIQGQIHDADHTQTLCMALPSSSASSQNINKFPAINQNGGGITVNSGNTQSDPRINIHMFVNQDSKQMAQCANSNEAKPDDLKDLSNSPQNLDCGQHNAVALISSVQDKESHSDIHNGSSITSNNVLPSHGCNGEVALTNTPEPQVLGQPGTLGIEKVGIPCRPSCEPDLKEIYVQPPDAKTKVKCNNNKTSLPSGFQQQPVGSSDAGLLGRNIVQAATSSNLSDSSTTKSEPLEGGMKSVSGSGHDLGGRHSNRSSQAMNVRESNKVLNSPASSGTVKQDVHDVESQMEALFAGIADDGKSGIESNPLDASIETVGTPNIAAVLESKSSNLRKGKGKAANGMPRAADGIFGTSSAESTPRKRRKMKSAKDKSFGEGKSKKLRKIGPGKGKFIKESSCDNGSISSLSRARGPVVHIEGPKEAPTLISVINAPSRLEDEDNENRKKGVSISRGRKTHSSEVSSTGLCGASLISRYEAHSSDPRWVCVFCKKGCHVHGLGDLFGPYLVKQNPESDCNTDLEVNVDRKPADKKSKRSGLGQTGVQGLLPIPPQSNEPLQYMVWIHEDCAIWAEGVHLIGSRLVGLQEAVWMAVRTKCGRCNADGAMLGCHQHGCGLRVHYQCAIDEGWNLDEDLFISTCHLHHVNNTKLS